MSSIFLIGTPTAFSPIAAEFAIGSCIYITLLLKPTARYNFILLLISSIFKLLACSAVLATNLNPLGWANIPFLLFQLINEVTLLVWVIQRQKYLTVTVISRLYKVGFKAIRVAGELFTTAIISTIAIVAPLYDCPCKPTSTPLFGTEYSDCNKPHAARVWSMILTPQIRGLSFVICIIAGAVSMSGLHYLIAGFTARINGRQNNALEFVGEDMEWKRKVRGVLSGLVIIVAPLFLGSYFLPGFRHCVSEDFMDQPNSFLVHMVYDLSPLSSSLFNALIAISQMFISDILLRCSASIKSQMTDSDSDSEI